MVRRYACSWMVCLCPPQSQIPNENLLLHELEFRRFTLKLVENIKRLHWWLAAPWGIIFLPQIWVCHHLRHLTLQLLIPRCFFFSYRRSCCIRSDSRNLWRDAYRRALLEVISIANLWVYLGSISVVSWEEKAMFISGHFIGGSWSSRSVFSRQGFLGIYWLLDAYSYAYAYLC